MSEIREPLITTTISNLTAQTIASSVGRVYLSKPMIANQEDAVRIIDTWRSVHVPTAGALIPNTCVIVSRTADSGILPLFTPVANKSYVLYAADVLNGGGVPGEINIGYTNAANDKFVTIKSIGANPGATTAFDISTVFFDSGAPIAIRMTSGTASDHTVSILYGEVVQ